MISSSNLNALFLVAFVTDNIKISFVSLKASLRWLCTFRLRKVSVTERMYVLRMHVLRMHVLRMHVLRMHVLRMHVLRIHVLQMHVLPPRFVQYSCKFSNLKLFSLKSQRYIVLTSLYSWMKISRLAAFSKRFSKLTYVLKSSWSNRSSIALMIQSKVLKYILRKWEITSLAHFQPKLFCSCWCSSFPKQF